jgi:hypothetical protein
VRRTVLALSVAGVIGGLTLPSLASTLPVGVTYSTKDGVSAGVTVQGQPAAGARVSNGEACAGISYQLPVCVGVGPITR